VLPGSRGVRDWISDSLTRKSYVFRKNHVTCHPRRERLQARQRDVIYTPRPSSRLASHRFENPLRIFRRRPDRLDSILGDIELQRTRVSLIRILKTASFPRDLQARSLAAAIKIQATVQIEIRDAIAHRLAIKLQLPANQLRNNRLIKLAIKV